MKYISITALMAATLMATSCTHKVMPEAAPVAPANLVSTWATAPQLVEPHNNPPAPYLSGNSLRQVVQISIGGEAMQLRFANYYGTEPVEINGAEVARALTGGESPLVDDASTVSLTFAGQKSVIMQPGQTVTSDIVKLHLDPRANVAITLHLGTCSNTIVTGHPGSRTTSYIAEGQTSDFSKATRTDHWYLINAIDILPVESSASVAILGNSITDGRGSTTNGQNRWPDVFSKRLLDNAKTQHVGVLNFGIGGNCVIAGGLGPNGKDRYRRDLLSQQGVKWIILFEGVNDLGTSPSAVQVADQIIAVYNDIIHEAHNQGIRVYGTTIMPFKGNGYYSDEHEAGRQKLNQWVRTSTELDGVIDFDHAIRDPQDTLQMRPSLIFENDWLHPNAAGHQLLGESVDLKLFEQ